ncbi:MAG TPA: hypothetical protein VGN60_02820 [Devosia sp.]|jgi:hypothetical protein|nr:hypothetical protein [Devosia sp.]
MLTPVFQHGADRSVVEQAFQLWKIITLLDDAEGDDIEELQTSDEAYFVRESTRQLAAMHPAFADYELERHLAK